MPTGHPPHRPLPVLVLLLVLLAVSASSKSRLCRRCSSCNSKLPRHCLQQRLYLRPARFPWYVRPGMLLDPGSCSAYFAHRRCGRQGWHLLLRTSAESGRALYLPPGTLFSKGLRNSSVCRASARGLSFCDFVFAPGPEPSLELSFVFSFPVLAALLAFSFVSVFLPRAVF